MKKKIFIVAGTLSILFSALWYFLIFKTTVYRIPKDWEYKTTFTGESSTFDEQKGEFPLLTTTFYSRTQKIINDKYYPDSIKIEDNYSTFDLLSNKKIWEYNFYATINPKTGEHLNPAFKNNYFVFPLFVEKKDYLIRYNYIKGIKVSFLKEETINELNTYIFQYKGRGEYSESYAGTNEYPGTKVAVGQEIKCADDQFFIKFWVEPTTGNIVKINENCYVGDYLYDIATGKKLTPIMRWGGYTSGNDVLMKIEEAKSEKFNMQLMSTYLSAFVCLIGACFIFLGLRKKKKVE